ncbi:uncharacterized protein LOC112680479 [Sipha flava]|uniref:Uncharacterized protein LOC112680479 n=1 Tax=Sipha flava TaxID=143950 RepID=A0A8B8F7P3_9HEMI|nr:uncharacterized protein LOC112680479 [Sipha flava]
MVVQTHVHTRSSGLCEPQSSVRFCILRRHNVRHRNCLRRDNYCLFDRKEKRKQRIWMKEWLKKRVEFGHDRLVSELKLSSIVYYKNYLRMDADTFGELLEMATPLIEKNTTVMRTPISAEQRLLATLRYLVSGNSFEELKFQTAIAAQTLGRIILKLVSR